MSIRIRVDKVDSKGYINYLQDNRFMLQYIGPELIKGDKYMIRLDFSPASCADLCIKVISTDNHSGIIYLDAEVL